MRRQGRTVDSIARVINVARYYLASNPSVKEKTIVYLTASAESRVTAFERARQYLIQVDLPYRIKLDTFVITSEAGTINLRITTVDKLEVAPSKILLYDSIANTKKDVTDNE